MATDVPCFDKLEGLAVGGTATVMSAITGARPLRLNGARRWVLTLECTHVTRGVSLVRWRRRGYEGDGADQAAWPWSPWVTSTVTLSASGGATPTGEIAIDGDASAELDLEFTGDGGASEVSAYVRGGN